MAANKSQGELLEKALSLLKHKELVAEYDQVAAEREQAARVAAALYGLCAAA